MTVYAAPDFNKHEQVAFFYDPGLDLKAIIAIHNTTLGPALGGCRIWPYETEQQAVYDVLRLSRGMTYKAAIAGLNLGGGKMVVMADPKIHKSPAFFHKIGEFVESLKGRYITAEDVGVRVDDVKHIQEKTKHVVGLAEGHGDPSPFTAYGVYRGMMTAVEHKLGAKSLAGVRVVVQGLGSVGYNLCKLLHREGATLLVHDIHAEPLQRVQEEFGATLIRAADVYSTPADVYAPCALGATINKDTIDLLQVQVVCGGANNQLLDPSYGRLLKQKNILYAPDYVVNQGGLVCVWYEQLGDSTQKVYAHIDEMHDTLMDIFALSLDENISTEEAANQIAEARFMP